MFVELEIKMVLAITYLAFQIVYPLVATIHDSLVADGPCSWAGSTIDEPPNLVKGAPFLCIASENRLGLSHTKSREVRRGLNLVYRSINNKMIRMHVTNA